MREIAACRLGLQSLQRFPGKIIPLLGSRLVPPHGIRPVRHDALAVLVTDGEPTLRPWVALLGGRTVPPDRFHQVSRDALAVLIADRESGLRRRVTLFGRGAVPPHRLR
jgi:hypothetical protein